MTHERLASDTNRIGWFEALRIGGTVMETYRRRLEAYDSWFPFSSPTGDEPYYLAESWDKSTGDRSLTPIPIVQVGEKSSGLSDALLDGLSKGEVRLWGVAGQRPQITGPASGDLRAIPASPLTRIEHQVDGEAGILDGWYVTATAKASTYGSNITLLIGPDWIELQKPTAEPRLLLPKQG